MYTCIYIHLYIYIYRERETCIIIMIIIMIMGGRLTVISDMAASDFIQLFVAVER